MKQLRVWAGAEVLCFDLDCAFAASPLLAATRLVQSPATGVGSVTGLLFAGELAHVSSCDGLRVVSTAGLGLKWFEPHSRNVCSVVLAQGQADDSVPVWLTAGDVVVDVLFFVAAGASTVSAAVVVQCQLAQHDTVCVVYGGLSEDVPEAVLQLTVCGVPAADATGDSDWCVRVPRRPLASHECAAVGTHFTTLAVVKGAKFGMAVSADEKWLVVGLLKEGKLFVYSLPEGEPVRSFGGYGTGPLQFNWLERLCFSPNSNLIVVDKGNKRLQEVTLEGVFVRFIGVGELDDGDPFCVAVHDDVIAVGCSWGTTPRVVLFDVSTGELTSRFGEVGTVPGLLSYDCTGIRFTLDGSHVIVAENAAQRLSLFTIDGVFVRCVGVGVLGGWFMDVLQSVIGEYVVADSVNHRVCVFSLDGSELVRSWGAEGSGVGQFEGPTALAAAGPHLYVMDWRGGRVQVFE